jgi:hypothetical protein
MDIKDLLDRFELLNPGNQNIVDLRRGYVEKDLHSIFRLVKHEELIIENAELKKLIMDNNIWSLWKLLTAETSTNFVPALKYFASNNININEDCFSRGQLKSKVWLVQELKKLDLDLGTVFLCAGWYATLATLMFENNLKIKKIRSFDIDPSCVMIAERFNKPWEIDEWRFKAVTKDILDINYTRDTYTVSKPDGLCELTDSPDTIVNTSCEHIEDFSKWYDKIPAGKLIVLQTNNYIDNDEHVNCSENLTEFEQQTPMSSCLYSGELVLDKYTRYMRIGYR